LHQIGLVAMGLMMLDCTDMEVLRAACARHQRSTFMLSAAPLRIPGGTGSPVNPLAIF
ncbi:MAG: cyclase, partial [Chloroflexi bacterium]|nr:cyclase [Chloroflexota bacterium]